MPYIPKVLFVKDTIKHGGFKYSEPTATVLKVSNIRGIRVPVLAIDSKALDEFEECVGFTHTRATWIRSYIMLYGDIYSDSDVEVISNVADPVEYSKALAQHFTDVDHDYSFEYDFASSHGFQTIPEKFYEFDLPSEFYCVIPMELGAWYDAIRDTQTRKRVLSQLAYDYLYSTIPITNIRIVEETP